MDGRSEELLGETGAESQGFAIDTKILTQAGDHHGEMERSAVEKSVDTSLQRMGVKQLGVSNFHTLASGFLAGKLTHGTAEGTRFGHESSLKEYMQSLYDQEALPNALKALEATTQFLGITTIDAAWRWAYYHSVLGGKNGII
ncbi:uncharacterized protein ATNIH1004_005210 [Aspergillus tanneri]|uniref:NADP-dependent oxidoreductase domain-containing protein n=1 Tax=Aspergillus tanneri TaxID=1220188 RepID=A0A5M9MXE7_9EURO|nr:uncharacterized protein ATNIH1004_005210 [Aspergillus tanneri]KAA8649309.1 hypothetical protein ATNIH1004_005210 [Aspergillus tanneri]